MRLAGVHALCDVLYLEGFHEDHPYENLDWLCEHQSAIEDRLLRGRYADQGPGLSLYDVTVEEGLSALAGICATEVVIQGQARAIRIPRPRPDLDALLQAAQVRLPAALPSKGVVVSTKKKLPQRRKKH